MHVELFFLPFFFKEQRNLWKHVVNRQFEKNYYIDSLTILATKCFFQSIIIIVIVFIAVAEVCM